MKELQEKLRIQEKNGIKQQERYAILEQKYKDFQSFTLFFIFSVKSTLKIKSKNLKIQNTDELTQPI